jgi:hypothetical protein
MSMSGLLGKAARIDQAERSAGPCRTVLDSTAAGTPSGGAVAKVQRNGKYVL